MTGPRREFGITPYPQEWSRLLRYGVALAMTVGAVISAALLLGLSDSPIYAPLIGAVALAAWLGGVGPALLSIGVGWTLALVVLVRPRWEFAFGTMDDLTRWIANLVVAVVIVGIAALLRLGRLRAVDAATVVSTSLARSAALQRLSAELARATTSAEVARAVATGSESLLQADGATLVVVDVDEVEVIEPSGLAADARVSGRRIPLAAPTLLTDAVRRREAVWVDDRAALETTYPDSAGMLPPQVESAAAVPLVIGAEVVGAVGFLFTRRGALDSETLTLAVTVSGLAAQALDRARLYESERGSRRALERILEVAPRFHAESEEEVTEAICHEARTAFGADYGVLWRIRDGTLELVRSSPIRDEWPSGLVVPLSDFPGLAEAVDTLGVSFVPDVLEEARGEGLERVRELGIRSSLRTPIVSAGRTELVLVVSWRTVVSEPDPSTKAIARRFADQAGLAFEQLERRRAEARAAVRADETERLQEVTAALSRAATRGDVGDTCLEHALRFVGAEAGFVVLTGSGGTSVQFVSQAGFADEALEAWKAFGLDADVPFARAIATGEPVWALSREEMDVFTGSAELDDAGWITIPLKTPAAVHGALHVSLREPLTLGDAERRWLQSVVSQCALALERSELYEREQQLRLQSERLQRLTAELSGAATVGNVADVVTAVAAEVTGASRATLWNAAVNGQPQRPLAATAPTNGDPEGGRGDDAVTRAARRGDAWLEEDSGRRLVIPLVAGSQPVGVLDLAWDAPPPLSDDDRGYLTSLAGQAAQALDRARHLETERSIAETLQRSVLPVSLPTLPGVQLAARYLPGTQSLDVGGDWFDAIEFADGRLGLVVGDVVGKGVHAAASMGQLRNALRAFSIDPHKPPSALQRLDRLSEEALDTTFATVIYAVVDRSTGTLRYSSAGHPPPVVAFPDGRVLAPEDGRGLPLGTGLGPKYRQAVVDLPAGSIVVLYTDGLVERRGRSIDEGIEALRRALADGPSDAGPLLDHVLDRLLGAAERGDDVAIIAARVSPVAPTPLELRVAAVERSLPLTRSVLRAWLAGTSLSTQEAEEVLLAAWEVCANAIEHAADPTQETVRIRARSDRGALRIVIEDSGRFVPAVTRPDRGLGLKLAGALSSSIAVTPSARGTRVTLERALPAESRLEQPDEKQDDHDERE